MSRRVFNHKELKSQVETAAARVTRLQGSCSRRGVATRYAEQDTCLTKDAYHDANRRCIQPDVQWQNVEVCACTKTEPRPCTETHAGRSQRGVQQIGAPTPTPQGWRNRLSEVQLWSETEKRGHLLKELGSLLVRRAPGVTASRSTRWSAAGCRGMTHRVRKCAVQVGSGFLQHERT